MITVFHKAKHKLPSCKDVLARVLTVDADTMRRLEDISTLSEENKKFILNMIDMALRDFKTKKAYAK